MTDGVGVRIQGDPDVIEELAAALADGDGLTPTRIETDDTAGIGADFALETVATLIGIASALFFSGPIVPKLLAILHKHHGTRITIETPTGSVSIESDGTLSPEALRKILDALATA